MTGHLKLEIVLHNVNWFPLLIPADTELPLQGSLPEMDRKVMGDIVEEHMTVI